MILAHLIDFRLHTLWSLGRCLYPIWLFFNTHTLRSLRGCHCRIWSISHYTIYGHLVYAITPSDRFRITQPMVILWTPLPYLTDGHLVDAITPIDWFGITHSMTIWWMPLPHAIVYNSHTLWSLGGCRYRVWSISNYTLYGHLVDAITPSDRFRFTHFMVI